jgi:hypothetical protein
MERAFGKSVLPNGLDDRGSIIGRDKKGTFSLPHRIQTCSAAQPASYPVTTGAVSPGVKRPEREDNHSSSSSTDFINVWSYTSTLLYVLMAGCLIKHRYN